MYNIYSVFGEIDRGSKFGRDVIKIVQSQDDQRGRLEERVGARVRKRNSIHISFFFLTCSACDVQRSSRESEQKLMRKSLLSFSQTSHKVLSKVD